MRFREVLLEAWVVAVVGAVFAFTANQLSPRGLHLGRDYFPRLETAAVLSVPHAQTNEARAAAPPAPASDAERLTARLKAQGLQVAQRDQVVQWYRDPRYEQELIVFVDARDDRHYEAGHIPGAYQLDHYQAEKYLPQVLPACQTAEVVLVYCTGGSCEDSEFAAHTLRTAGVGAERLFVYAGGFNEWATNGLPVELGGRRSGNLKGQSP